MSNPPFGFGFPDPDKRRENEPSNSGGEQQPGSGADAFQQLGQMLSQLGQMLSQAGSSSGPVNYDLAKQIALQRLAGSGGSSLGFSTGDQSGDTAVRDAAHLAELWLDEATILPAGASTTVAWTARDWVDKTLPTWQRLCDPVAKQVSGAWMQALPEEAKQAAGPLLSMVGQMGGMAFGSQLGNALAELASEVLTSSEVGLPLGPAATSALLPANIEKFTEGLERPGSEVMVFLAAREAAHQRLFAHVPWLRQRLLATVEEFAHGITVDTSALEQLAGQVDPSNPASIEQAMSSGLLEPKTTPEQQAALNRLETLLALVEGWVDVVVAEAVGDRLPGADALRETLRRRRATGGPAEQTFATLVGLELRPRRMRAASALWKLVGDRHGIDTRDQLWSHPDLMPRAEDLDDPMEFADRLGRSGEALDDLDPIAELERTRQAEEQAKSDEPGDQDDSGEDDKKS
ncbi:zinc-dependent metalloprotease [Prauserella endophytica]|uniref:Zinc-dependent metalloprotease n=1 Tax=Prauserella endophytica TaxID=1592324 RepID=A0ABY2RTG4_9PSEU|nr:zinc-dependent metalloprotease [Prauserella endophytica]PXY17613.1 hydrolase [Prauserella coralliicola]TKG59891.1 zinc-dependent metalloprotease [Prauserella endophytica]